MKRDQKGEVMLVVMVVLLVVGLLSGHMGMMGHGTPVPDKSSSSTDQKVGTSEHQH